MNAVSQSPAQALPLAAWLDVLSTVFPPRGAVVVGAGTGNGPWVQWLRSRRLSKVWLIEGDETQYRHLLRHLPQGCGWTPRLDVVAEAPTPAVFYRASNPAESGLIAPGHLRTLWPHLAEDTATEIQTPATLDTVLAEAGNEVNWLVLDCLPAGRLLRGGARRLDQLDLIAVRVGSEQPASGLDEESLHHTVDALLVSAGFVCVHTRGERHPALAHALYVRSPAAQQQRIGQAEQLATERTQALEAAQAALTTLQQERDTLAARSQQLESQVAALAQARDEQAKLREEAQQLAAEHSRQIDALKADLDKKIQTQESETPGLFSLSCYFDGLLVALRMNTTHPEWVQIDGDTVSYTAQPGAPLYLLGKEDGDFNLPPKQPQLLVEPGISYELSGRLEHLGDHRPQLWLFQYDGAKKLDSRSIAVDEAGRFRLGFQTLPATRCVVIGLRFADQGRLRRSDTYLRLMEQTGAVSTQNVEQRLQDFEKLQRREMENAVRQIESFIRLQHYLGPGTLVPEVHHWPVSPDFGVLLIELVEAHDYDAVIEFGSGTSTLILAKALQRVARKKRRRPSPLLSFDHLEQYQRKSQRSLEQAGVAAHARVELSPLQPWRRGDGVEFAYYACDAALCALRQDIDTAGVHLLVVVDGPPAATGPQARYPALPKVLDALGAACRFHFLMDDYLRPDEQEIVKAWEAHAAHRGLACTRTEFHQLEKKACLLEIRPESEPANQKGSE